MDNKNRRILLVDDDRAVLDVTEKILNKLGYNVICHADATQALELFRDLPDQFDLVITDFNMPDRNGAELARELLGINPRLPIIIASGSGSEVDLAQIRASGARFFIRKPFLNADFVALVSQALDGRHENIGIT